MAYTFAVDTEKLDKLGQNLERLHAGLIRDYIEEIFGYLEMDESVWSGEGYATFHSGCEAYRGAVSEVPAIVSCFANYFKLASDNAESLIENVTDALQSIE